MIKTIIFIPLIVALSGCGMFGASKPDVVEVETVLPVYCNPQEVLPPIMPLQTARSDMPLSDKIRRALAEIELRKAYETRLKNSIDACREKQPK